jgi:hypothetical protein
MAKSNVTMEQFVEAWETSGSVQEVSAKTGIKVSSCQTRAAQYREKDIDLKSMRKGGGRKLDVAAAKALLAKLRAPAVVDEVAVGQTDANTEETENTGEVS